MRIYFVGACVGLLLACSVYGQEPAVTKAPPATKQSTTAKAQADLSEMLQANIRAMWAAFRDKKKQAYAEYLWDDYTAVEEDSQGERNKLRVLREVDESVVHDYTLQLFKVDTLGPDAALVTYENVIQFPPKSRTRFEKIFISEIWLKRHGQWKAWRYQATRVK
jgi:ketosteroid isomerase-like protein